MRERPVNPRASRRALITASVPELTRRTCSIDGQAARDELRHLQLELGRRAEGKPARGRRGDRREHLRVGVAEDGRAPRADVVDVAVAVDVDEPGALAFAEEDGRSADGAEGAHGRIHAAGNDPLRGFKELLAAFVHGSRVPCRRVVKGRARPAATSGASKSEEITASMSAPAATASAALAGVMPPMAATGIRAPARGLAERGEPRANRLRLRRGGEHAADAHVVRARLGGRHGERDVVVAGHAENRPGQAAARLARVAVVAAEVDAVGAEGDCQLEVVVHDEGHAALAAQGEERFGLAAPFAGRPSRLARYWTRRAPPSMARSHEVAQPRQVVGLGRDGVEAAQPRAFAHSRSSSSASRAQNRRSGMCWPMPGRKRAGQRLPGVVLGFVDGLGHLEAAREVGGDGRRERAARAVVAARAGAARCRSGRCRRGDGACSRRTPWHRAFPSPARTRNPRRGGGGRTRRGRDPRRRPLPPAGAARGCWASRPCSAARAARGSRRPGPRRRTRRRVPRQGPGRGPGGCPDSPTRSRPPR